MEKFYRVLDVDFNRAREGLRVLEDCARFYLEEAELTGALRDLRHRLSRLTLETFPRAALLAGRESERDLGRNFKSPDRRDWTELVQANSLRVSEALRSLEEVSKVLGPDSTPAYQELRFRFYQLEKGLARFYRSRLPDFPVYAIIEPGAGIEADVAFARRLLAAGVRIIQLRLKCGDDRDFLDLAVGLAGECRKAAALFVVNDRPDIALLTRAGGIHLGQRDLPPAEVRRICPHLVLGASVNSEVSARRALAAGVDYLAVGAIFPTATKEAARPVGLEMLRRVKRLAGERPVVAIGGLNPGNAGAAYEAGADYLAVISCLRAGRPEKTVAALAAARDESIKKLSHRPT
ncbi:MAG: Thiamine-phosphate synthase [candidate division TA06 bacterium ADurb.Bin417]|uniref:Thiamine-phosphate synthase n=1 Tax=candidate division TA06 bacterium ADurb.Bin417 TaxID=1852828 RepID=A0A1V5M7A6_UNCT6|nr:MAG: Thiamine-phosphate synthase [candidate division TA06 bacterium ADurb.Bin417]